MSSCNTPEMNRNDGEHEAVQGKLENKGQRKITFTCIVAMYPFNLFITE